MMRASDPPDAGEARDQAIVPSRSRPEEPHLYSPESLTQYALRAYVWLTNRTYRWDGWSNVSVAERTRGTYDRQLQMHAQFPTYFPTHPDWLLPNVHEWRHVHGYSVPYRTAGGNGREDRDD